jgi:2-polyprenyl-6-methoxyphenol hydroxylase-like FAD-dependent oxidoreductase
VVTGLLARVSGGPIPRIDGVRLQGGEMCHSDVVVDAGGRRSSLPDWIEAAGGRRPTEFREESGFVYFGRHFRTRDGEMPEGRGSALQHFASTSLVALPADNGTYSVGFVASATDKKLRALRDPDRWDAALARYPTMEQWGRNEPITGVDVMAGIEDRRRRYVVDGAPVATGVIPVGDAWACTNPSLGRGMSIGLLHACLLREVLRDTGIDDDEKLVHRFDEATETWIAPIYEQTLGGDRHRLAEIEADIAGEPYAPDDESWKLIKAMTAAMVRDGEVARAFSTIAGLLESPQAVLARPGMRERIVALAADAPQYAYPGPTRRELETLLAA